jgi:hypothetical protein
MLGADGGRVGLFRRWSEPDQPDGIVVGTGSNRIRRTQVGIIRRAGETRLQVEPPGPMQVRLINMFGIARKVHRVLLAAPGLGSGATTAGMG